MGRAWTYRQVDTHEFDQMVRDFASGDAGAYRRLLAASARVVRAYLAARMTGPARADLEDVVQETLLNVHTKFHSYDQSLPYVPWLRTIAHHKLVDHWRRRRFSGTVPLDDGAAETLAAPESDVAASNATLTLERYLAALNAKQRRVVELARIAGKSMADIAQEMDISVADAKVTLHRALRKLAQTARADQEVADAHG
ncbi:MAG: sigma-70 family RNA polymerase sigma factor [Rhodospirillales bacterium]|nr:sigma-70 family RNA polymerase sigma factor [Alphaproteobacteria bacterium]MCB9986641.1 sigma-70 family RNA polymerase sigma factor [Rhodospirillales bacterium]USO06831.1 MAG: sigma-70 family RNA polymerase sigma factor [Rhodospirillales bacterium]